jgi:phosphonate dehydrogenase
MTAKIVVANWVHPEVLDLLSRFGTVERNETREPWSTEELIRRCQGASALMAFMTESVDANFLEACPSLRMIACALKGYDNFDLAACRARGVTVSIVPDLLTAPTAELTVGLMIALGRQILSSDQFVRSGTFSGWRPRFYGTGLDGSKVGIAGMGAVGRAVAARLAGFGCEVSYCDPHALEPEEERRLNIQRTSLEELVSTSDYVVLIVPLVNGSLHLFGGDLISQMKPGALLINTGRGSVVDELAVASALASGHLGGYAADVFEFEDWAREDRPRTIPAALLESDRTVLTSHIGSAVDRVRKEIALEAARNIAQFLEGKRPQGAIR